MKGGLVYSTNAEDFIFTEPDDCLERVWNDCFDDAPMVAIIYQATDTGILADNCDNENATEVTDFIELTYKRTNTDFDYPSWELLATVKSASKHVWLTPT